MLLVDATGGQPVNTSAEIIVAVGGAISAIIGAVALFGRRRTAEPVAVPVEFPDPEDRPARLRERLTALETTSRSHGELLEAHSEEISLLRAGQLTSEGIDRLAHSIAAQLQPPRRRAP